MRYLIGLALVLMLVVGVETARADCGCRGWAITFASDPNPGREFERQVKLRWPSSYWARKRIKQGIYDYAARGDFKSPFCKRSPAHAKACKAAKACVLAAGPVWIAQVARGHDHYTAAMEAIPACVGAVLTVYLIA